MIPTTIITDCYDDNVAGRQISRCASLLQSPTTLVGVRSDLEAAGNLIDMLDAYEGRPGVILVNVAPRNADAKRWPNGTPFGYFYHNGLLIVATIDGLTLSLVKKLEITDEIQVMDIPTALTEMMDKNFLSKKLKEHIVNTQFRSFNFVPRVAAYLMNYKSVAHKKMSINEVKDAPEAIWWVDNFGNCKTTLFKEEIEIKNGMVKTKMGNIEFHDSLKDVADNEAAIIVGSSGLKKEKLCRSCCSGGKLW